MTKYFKAAPLLLGLALIAFNHGASAQAVAAVPAPLTRAQVKMDREEFVKSHHWDDQRENWLLNDGMEPPEGVKPRAVVKSERDDFLRNNHWDNARSAWTPLGDKPRDLGKMSREQVRADTQRFATTHTWNAFTQSWTLRTPAAKS